MRALAIALAIAVIVFGPAPAFAYVGPGAGLSLLGALWALIAAIGLAIAFVVAWPIRKMMRNRRLPPPAKEPHADDEAARRHNPDAGRREG